MPRVHEQVLVSHNHLKLYIHKYAPIIMYNNSRVQLYFYLIRNQSGINFKRISFLSCYWLCVCASFFLFIYFIVQSNLGLNFSSSSFKYVTHSINFKIAADSQNQCIYQIRVCARNRILFFPYGWVFRIFFFLISIFVVVSECAHRILANDHSGFKTSNDVVGVF